MSLLGRRGRAACGHGARRSAAPERHPIGRGYPAPTTRIMVNTLSLAACVGWVRKGILAMIISNTKRFVILAPWKTASQTIHHRFRQYNDSPYPCFYYLNKYLNRVVHQHITCAEFACLPESNLGYHLAAFVRNPYDRVYSGFRQLQVDIQNQPFATFSEPWVRDLIMSQLAENFSQLCQASFQFDAWFALVRDEQVYEVGRNSSFPLHPAYYWTHIANSKVVNFIGKIENFENDLETLTSRVGIDNLESGNLNIVDIVGRSLENPFGYRYLHLMNSSSITKINRLFSNDFEQFAYEQIT